jgi:hypothetical protein
MRNAYINRLVLLISNVFGDLLIDSEVIKLEAKYVKYDHRVFTSIKDIQVEKPIGIYYR